MAQQSLRLNASNFDVSRLVLEKPVANEKRKNVYSAKLRYLDDNDEPQYFFLYTPKLFTPFGANSYNEDDKYALTFTLGDDGKDGEFKTLLESIETRVSELVGELKGKLSKNEFSKLVKPSKDPKYKPTFSVKLKCNEQGELFADVFDRKKTVVKVNLENITTELPRRSKVGCVLMLNNVWFVNKNCGVTVNAKQLIVFPGKDKGCMFEGDDFEDSDVDGEGNGDNDEHSERPTLEDSEDDEEDDE